MRQELYKMIVEDMQCQRRRRNEKKTKNNDRVMSKGHKRPTEKVPNGHFEQENEILFDYNPKYKINTHESTLL